MQEVTSRAAFRVVRRDRAGPKRLKRFSELGYIIGAKRIVRPPAGPPVGDEAGLTQHLQVEGKERLGDLKFRLQFADAALAS